MSDGAARDLRADILESFTQLMEHVTRWRQLDMADVDVTMPQARCLLLISLNPSMSISALASHLHIGLPSASGLVERLVEAGYVERNPDPRDRRQQLVTLSGRGRSLVDRLHELPTAKLSELLAGLSLAELRGLRLGVLAIEREAGLIAERIPPEPDPERTTA